MLYARSPGVDTPHSWLASPCVDAARRSSPRLREADARQNMAGGMQPASAQSGARATPVSGGASPVIHRDEAQRAIVVHRPPRRAHARRVAVAQAATAASTQMEAAPSPCFEQASPVLGSAPSPPVNQRADHFVVRKAAEIPYMPMNPPVRRGKRGQGGPGRGPGDAQSGSSQSCRRPCISQSGSTDSRAGNGRIHRQPLARCSKRRMRRCASATLRGPTERAGGERSCGYTCAGSRPCSEPYLCLASRGRSSRETGRNTTCSSRSRARESWSLPPDQDGRWG